MLIAAADKNYIAFIESQITGKNIGGQVRPREVAYMFRPISIR